MLLFTFVFTMTFPVSYGLSEQRVISIFFFIKFKNRYIILIKSEFLLSQNSKRYLEDCVRGRRYKINIYLIFPLLAYSSKIF